MNVYDIVRERHRNIFPNYENRERIRNMRIQYFLKNKKEKNTDPNMMYTQLDALLNKNYFGRV